jgi:ABC-2 type transport system permease protein
MTASPNASTFEGRVAAPAPQLPTRPFYWSVRRELWENRSIYLAPLAAGGIFLIGFLINMRSMRRRLIAAALDAAKQHEVLLSHYELAAALVMGTAFIVGIFYSLDALYGERRDKSILFWKSLPVSDLTTVLSKLTVPMVILPLLSFVITVVVQFIMLLLISGMLAGSGISIAGVWAGASFVHVSLALLYHVITVHGLWYAPIYGWLFLVSAWATRAPFIWAFLPPFVICGLEKIAFNTTYCLGLLQYRLEGPQNAGTMAPGGGGGDMIEHLIPHNFFTTPGLWTGLIVGAAFIYAAVRIRRYRGPI